MYSDCDGGVVVNPFRPTFGVEPPLLVGREAQLSSFQDALAGDVGHPGRATLVVGARGTGKSSLLSAMERTAKQAGWIVVPEIVRPGLAQQLATDVLPEAMAKASSRRAQVTGVNVSAVGFGAGFSRQVAEPGSKNPGVSTSLNRLLDIAEDKDTGVLITLDEVHRVAIDDLREITQAVQLAFKARRQLVFAAAGLPASVDAVLNDPILTFLKRSTRFELGWLDNLQTLRAIEDPILDSGKTIDEEALWQSVTVVGGHPYFIQMMGFQLWETAKQSAEITTEHFWPALRATQSYASVAYRATLADLSVKDREFLYAMAQDEGPSTVGDIARRIRSSSSLTGAYRRRLTAAGIVQSVAYGKVDLALPLLRGYLRELAVRKANSPHQSDAEILNQPTTSVSPM
jgi:hypothetical protein